MAVQRSPASAIRHTLATPYPAVPNGHYLTDPSQKYGLCRQEWPHDFLPNTCFAPSSPTHFWISTAPCSCWCRVQELVVKRLPTRHTHSQPWSFPSRFASLFVKAPPVRGSFSCQVWNQTQIPTHKGNLIQCKRLICSRRLKFEKWVRWNHSPIQTLAVRVWLVGGVFCALVDPADRQVPAQKRKLALFYSRGASV